MVIDSKSIQALPDRVPHRPHGVTLLSLGAFLCALFLLTALLLWSQSTLKLDRLLHDTWVRSDQREAPKDIVIVGIDAQSLQDFGRWPWSRPQQAELFEKLGATKAAGVVLDITYTEPAEDPSDDLLLAETIKALPTTVLPILTENRTSATEGRLERLPIPAYLRHVKHLGLVQLPIDEDGIVRRVFLMAGYNAPHWPTLALAAHQAITPEDQQSRTLPGIRSQPEVNPEVNYDKWLQDFEVMIPFYGRQGAFKTVSAGDVLKDEISASLFDNKIVLVGLISKGLHDIVPTPVGVSAIDQSMPGVEVHANLLAAIRDGSLVTRIDSEWNLFIALAMLPFLMWVYSRAGPLWSLLAAISVACAPIVFSYLLYHNFRLWYPPLAASIPMLVSYLAWSGNRLQFVNRFLASQSRKLDLEQARLEQAPRERSTNEDLAAFFNQASMHLPIEGWRFSTKTQSHVGGESPPQKISGITDVWVRKDDVYSRRFPTDDRLELIVAIKDPKIASELTRYIDGLPRVRRRVKTSIWRGSVEQLQTNALKLGDQLDHLRAVKSFSNMILEGSPTGFLVWRVVGELIRENDLALRLLPSVGKQPLMREFVERAGIDLTDPGQSLHFEDLIQRGKPWQFTVHQDEKELLIGMSAVGASLGERLICATVIDVSEIRTAERARAEMMDYLSHDLRSPLVSSLYLLDAEGEDITAEELAGARRNIQSSLLMMDNLLHMSRADTVSVESFKEVLLDNVIDNVTTHFIPQARARNITVHTSVCDEELWVFGDAGLLDRAIGNLLSNAIKYSDDGGDVWLDISVESSARTSESATPGATHEVININAATQIAVITVRDDGVGIDPAIIDSLFTRFKRDPSVADQFRGIGLGLALVSKVALQHSGTVSAHSSGEGAEFVFRIPLGLDKA